MWQQPFIKTHCCHESLFTWFHATIGFPFLHFSQHKICDSCRTYFFRCKKFCCSTIEALDCNSFAWFELPAIEIVHCWTAHWWWSSTSSQSFSGTAFSFPLWVCEEFGWSHTWVLWLQNLFHTLHWALSLIGGRTVGAMHTQPGHA